MGQQVSHCVRTLEGLGFSEPASHLLDLFPHLQNQKAEIEPFQQNSSAFWKMAACRKDGARNTNYKAPRSSPEEASETGGVQAPSGCAGSALQVLEGAVCMDGGCKESSQGDSEVLLTQPAEQCRLRAHPRGRSPCELDC